MKNQSWIHISHLTQKSIQSGTKTLGFNIWAQRCLQSIFDILGSFHAIIHAGPVHITPAGTRAPFSLSTVSPYINLYFHLYMYTYMYIPLHNIDLINSSKMDNKT